MGVADQRVGRKEDKRRRDEEADSALRWRVGSRSSSFPARLTEAPAGRVYDAEEDVLSYALTRGKK